MAASFHLLFFLVLLLAAGSAEASADDDAQLRREAMAEALGVVSGFDLATTDPVAIMEVKRALAVLEAGVKAQPERWKTIFKAVDMTMDAGADDRAREVAIAEAKVLVDLELGQCPNCKCPDYLRRQLGYL